MTYSTTQGIASRAATARREAGVTVDTLAQALGVSRRTMSRRLAGSHAWHSDEFEAAATALGITVDQLVIGERGAA